MVVRRVIVLILTSMSFVGLAQDVELISERNAPANLKDYTLLILKFEKKDTTDFEFKNKVLVDNRQTQKFIDKENKKVVKLNNHMLKEFKKYNFDYQLISESELGSYPKDQYPYTFENYLVKRVGKKAKAHALTNFYTHGFYIYNRKTKKPYSDINLFSHNIFREIQVIIRALNFYLESTEY